MSRNMSEKKVFRKFVDSLTEEQVREQLVLAYLQMEHCNRILHGADVSPVSMLDNGMSTDLELFYECKKVREELDYLSDDEYEEEEEDGNRLTFSLGIDTSGLEEGLERAREMIREFNKSATSTFKIAVEDE